jgi:hypothetical protein
MINLWANVAPSLIDAIQWGDLFGIGQELFIAHMLTLDGMANAEAARGGLVGYARGALASEGGDKVSVSYQGSAMMEGAGHWNMTLFGIRYWQLMRLVGTGAIGVGPNPFAGAAPGVLGGGWGMGGPSNMQF